MPCWVLLPRDEKDTAFPDGADEPGGAGEQQRGRGGGGGTGVNSALREVPNMPREPEIKSTLGQP